MNHQTNKYMSTNSEQILYIFIKALLKNEAQDFCSSQQGRIST